jgi:hypothetical protein
MTFPGFEIFNPETDDLDSEEDDNDNDIDDHSSSDSSQESVVSAPNKSENEKSDSIRQTQSLDDPTQQGIVNKLDLKQPVFFWRFINC